MANHLGRHTASSTRVIFPMTVLKGSFSESDAGLLRRDCKINPRRSVAPPVSPVAIHRGFLHRNFRSGLHRDYGKDQAFNPACTLASRTRIAVGDNYLSTVSLTQRLSSAREFSCLPANRTRQKVRNTPSLEHITLDMITFSNALQASVSRPCLRGS